MPRVKKSMFSRRKIYKLLLEQWQYKNDSTEFRCTEGWEGDFASVMKWHMLQFKCWQIWYQMKAWNLRDIDLNHFFRNHLNEWSKSLSKDGKVHILKIHCFLTKNIEWPNTKKCQQTIEFWVMFSWNMMFEVQEKQILIMICISHICK